MLTQERDNLKEITFDLMLDHQKVDNIDHPAARPVVITEELQREFDLKHPCEDEGTKKLKTLLEFANDHIKQQIAEIKRLKQLIAGSEVEPEELRED